MTILITGAAGKTGRAIIAQLRSSHQPVRALVHTHEQASALQQLGAGEIVVGDMLDRATLLQAAHGISAIYHICPNMHAQEVAIGELAIGVAVEAGVERFVYHSVLHPQVEAMPHHWQKMRVEEMLFASQLGFTILQPAAYMQNILGSWQRIAHDGIYEVPYSLDTRLNMVDLRDVASVAVKVLTEEGHEGAIYELSGPENLSQRKVAERLARQLGRTVRGHTIARSAWERRARTAGLDDYAVSTLLRMFEYYEQFGFTGNAQVLKWLLDREPETLDTFLRRIVLDAHSENT